VKETSGGGTILHGSAFPFPSRDTDKPHPYQSQPHANTVKIAILLWLNLLQL